MIDRNALLLVPMLLPATAALGCEALAEEPHDRCSDLARAIEPDSNSLEARYVATYTHLNGDCGELDIPRMVTFDGTQIETFASIEVETQVSLNGCSMFFAQTVRDRATGRIQVDLDGPRLVAEDSDTISGTVTATRLDPLGMTTCLGEYDARLERLTVTLGASE